MRTSFHHQPEAQHPNFQLSTSWQADYPIFGSLFGLKSDISRGPRMGWTGRAPAPNGSQSAPGACQERSTTIPRTTTLHAVTAIGIDMGKNTLHLIGLDARGAIVLREKVARGRIALRLANLPPCLIGIEAGMATHYVAREVAALGHDVKQVPATYAKPFRQGHKNDFRDAHAVAEAVQRPTTRFVPAKTNEQLDLQALHRVRSRLVSERTAVINQIRGFLLERGIVVRQGLRFLRQQLPDILAKRTDVLSPRMARIVADLASDWRRLDERIETVTDEIGTLAKSDDSCRRVMTVPGIGPIISSAMVAAIGNGAAFARGRDFSAWLGLVPKQMSTGDRTVLGRISKRGNGYLRTLFMQAARVILLRSANWPKHSFGLWLVRAAQRLHPNVLAAALANKLARIAWTVLAQERSYEARVAKAAA
jgi:transposase